MLRVTDCIADHLLSPATEWQYVTDQIKAALMHAHLSSDRDHNLTHLLIALQITMRLNNLVESGKGFRDDRVQLAGGESVEDKPLGHFKPLRIARDLEEHIPAHG